MKECTLNDAGGLSPIWGALFTSSLDSRRLMEFRFKEENTERQGGTGGRTQPPPHPPHSMGIVSACWVGMMPSRTHLNRAREQAYRK